MRRALLLMAAEVAVGVAIAVVVAGCVPGSAGRPPSVGERARPASPPPSARSPAGAILTAADVGLPLVSAADGVSAVEAANQVPDAADALPLYSSWGWVEESSRHFAAAGTAVDVVLLETLRPGGAESAFGFWAAQAPGPCPPAVEHVDQCAAGSSGGGTAVVARVGAEVFRITATGTDPTHLAALQAARLT